MTSVVETQRQASCVEVALDDRTMIRTPAARQRGGRRDEPQHPVGLAARMTSAAPTTAAPEVASQWRIATVGRQTGLTRAAQGDGRDDLWLRLGDEQVVGARPPRLRSLLTARLTGSGVVHIVTRCAPPALLLTHDDAVLVPCEGRTRQSMELAPGDVLVMCSAAALEADPEGVVGVLADGAVRARRTSPHQLLQRVMRGTMVGAAAVVQRHPAAAGTFAIA